MADHAQIKQSLRKKIRAKRQQLSQEEQHQKALKLKEIISQQPFFIQSQKIAVYWPIHGEIDLRPLTQEMFIQNKKCYLPVLNQKTKLLEFVAYEPNTTLIPNIYGINEPEITLDSKLIPNNELDLVLLPSLAFDLEGFRLGSGAGLYDRTFAFLQAHKPKLWGVGYEFQIVDHLPHDSWDVRLDAIITEKLFYPILHLP